MFRNLCKFEIVKHWFFYKLKTDILRMLAVKMLPEAVAHRCSEVATTDALQNRRFKIFPIFSFL